MNCLSMAIFTKWIQVEPLMQLPGYTSSQAEVSQAHTWCHLLPGCVVHFTNLIRLITGKDASVELAENDHKEMLKYKESIREVGNKYVRALPPPASLCYVVVFSQTLCCWCVWNDTSWNILPSSTVLPSTRPSSRASSPDSLRLGSN